MAMTVFVCGALALLSTVCALVRIRHPAALSVPVMMLGWLAGELAVFHLAAQVMFVVIMALIGAIDGGLATAGLVMMVLSWVGLVRVVTVANRAGAAFAETLDQFAPGAGEELRSTPTDWRTNLRPFHFDKRDLDIERDIAYGPDPKHRLDVYRPKNGADDSRVLLFLHGGAWVSGTKKNQGLPMITALAGAGWTCVTADYRLGPAHRLPEMVDDVAAVVDFINTDLFTAPPWLAVAGTSAGGHLAAVVALRGEHDIQACIPIYGAFDLTDHLAIRGYARMTGFLQRMVMPTSLDDDPALWQSLSPIMATRADAPPFLVIHGTHDVFLWREETTAFVEKLRGESANEVGHVEVPGAQHTFDLFHSTRSQASARAVGLFLETVSLSERWTQTDV